MTDTHIVIRLSTRTVDNTEFAIATLMGRDTKYRENHPINLNDETCKEAWLDKYPKAVRGCYVESFAIEAAFYPCSVREGEVASYQNVGLMNVFRLERHQAKGASKAFDKLDRTAKKYGLDMEEFGDAVTAMALAFGATLRVEEDGQGRGHLYSDSNWHWREIDDMADFKRYVRAFAASLRNKVSSRIVEGAA